MIISFFHIGSDTSQAEMLCRSAKLAGKDLEIIQLSDNETQNKIFDHSQARRISLEKIMLSRMRAYRECLKKVNSPVSFLIPIC